MISSTSTSKHLVLSIESTTRGQVQVSDIPSVRRRARIGKSVENAVYAYIRAVRALGRTTIVTSEVAGALSLSVADVNRAISSLKKMGVRALNG
jgi:DNA-binding MarR family transcriptional regulator